MHDNAAHQYLCCCRSMHVLQGAKLIMWSEIVLSCVCLIRILFGDRDDYLADFRGFIVINITVTFLVCASTYFGLKNKKYYLLVPYLIYKVVLAVVSISICITILFGLVGIKSFPVKVATTSHYFYYIVLMILCAAVTICEICLLRIVFKTTYYLRNYRSILNARKVVATIS